MLAESGGGQSPETVAAPAPVLIAFATRRESGGTPSPGEAAPGYAHAAAVRPDANGGWAYAEAACGPEGRDPAALLVSLGQGTPGGAMDRP